MKSAFFILLQLFTVLSISAQEADQGTYKYDFHNVVQGNHTRETIIWSEDFNAGIPATWVNSGSPQLAVWEYRGPATNPDNTIGTRGSCLPEGQEGGAPIDSESLENGFVIFDSNYWDDDEGPCGNFGSGIAAAPHASSLTTNSINLSAYPYVGLEFNQYTKNFAAIHKVQLSINNQPFFDVFTQSLGLNAETSRDDLVSINISQYAGFQPNVKIRFLFEGSYYFWMIDDVKLIELDPSDLSLNDPTYGDFDINNLDHPTGYEYMEYSIYPQSMLNELKFSGSISNDGGLFQSNVQLNVSLDRTSPPIENLFIGESEGIFLNPGSIEILRAGEFLPDPVMGDYEITFVASQTEIDDQPENNTSQKSFAISSGIYARDHRSLEGIYVPAPQQQDVPYEFGNIYLITAPDQLLYSVECGISLGTVTGSLIYAALYEFDISVGVTADLIAQSGAVAVEGSDLNALGEEKMMSLNFDSPVSLQNGMAYAVMVGTVSGAPIVLTGISGDAPALTSWVNYPNNGGWFFLSKMPMVRMKLDDANSLNNLISNFEFNIWPNPVKNSLNIKAKDLIQIEVYSISGMLLKSEFTFNKSGVYTLNVEELPPSIYMLKLYNYKGNSVFSKVLKF